MGHLTVYSAQPGSVALSASHQETQKSAVSQGAIRKKNLAALVQEGNPKRERPKGYGRSVHAEAQIGIEELVSSQSAIAGKKMVFHTQRKRSRANSAPKSRFPRVSGILINSGPPVSKVAISKESFQGPALKKVTPQPNAFWTVKMQLVKRVW